VEKKAIKERKYKEIKRKREGRDNVCSFPPSLVAHYTNVGRF